MTQPTKPLNVALPAGLYDAVACAAFEDGRPKVAVAREALERWLKSRERRTRKEAA